MEGFEKLRRFALGEVANHMGPNVAEDVMRVIDEIEREMDERYVRLPVDADGVPIHFGDKVYITTTVVCTVTQLRYVNGKWQVGCTCENCMNYYSPQSIRHVKSDSWERIIADVENLYCEWIGSDMGTDEHEEKLDALVARCKALAGSDAE